MSTYEDSSWVSVWNDKAATPTRIKRTRRTTTTQQVLVDYSQDMIGGIRGRGFVVGTTEFGTRLKCGSDRGPTLL